jgi:MFS family permease
MADASRRAPNATGIVSDHRDRLVTREFLTLSISAALFFATMGAANLLVPKFIVDELQAGELWIGVIMGAFALAALTLRPWLGRLGDLRGARLLMLLGCALGAVGLVANVVVSNPVHAAIARLPFGAGQAAVMTGATALAVTLAPVHRRGEAASYILVAFQLGLGMGPVMAETIFDWSSYTTAFTIMAGGALLGGFVALGLPVRASTPHVDAPRRLLHPRGIVPGVVIGLGFFGFIGVLVFLPLYAQEVGVTRVAPLFLVNSSVGVVVRLVAARLPDVLGPIRGGLVSLAAIAAGLVIMAVWSSPMGLYGGITIMSVGTALLMPCMTPAVVEGVHEGERSSALATYTMSLDLAMLMAGPLLAVAVVATGYRGAFAIGALLAVVAGAILRHWLIEPDRRLSATGVT